MQTAGVNPNYCDIYNADGSEKMGDDHPRRIIGYFTSWRNGANNLPTFLAPDIPWKSITHINYAFAHIDENWEVSVGDTTDPRNPATGMTWDDMGPDYAMDPALAYKGHFNLLNQYAAKHDVKLLLSVGGWAETGGDNGGFYNLTRDPVTGAINHAAINKFAKSAAKFVKTYDFDGIDIDYEYPSSMKNAGNPLDWDVSNQQRDKLWAGYMALMEALRSELDKQGEQDNSHYMLTIASPSSGYLLRGFEGFQALQYLDYVNIMSYDLHGAWNSFVGHNAALFDTGLDAEIKDAKIYDLSTEEGRVFNQQGYLNIDWSYQYFLNALQGGRVNIGLPYYTRGWQDVTGGIDGLGGSAKLPNQKECGLGTGGNLGPHYAGVADNVQACGYGAQGIDNLWFDSARGSDGLHREVFGGANPLWHTNNLEKGLPMPYLDIYHPSDFDQDVSPDKNDPAYSVSYTKPEDKAVVGNYVEKYDAVAEASYLWNAEKQVFLTTENERSFRAKVQYAIDQGAGGIMFWEMAGDYSKPGENGRDHYWFGSTLTDIAYNMIAGSTVPMDLEIGHPDFVDPKLAVDVSVDLVDNHADGDDNYPMQPLLKLVNNSAVDLTGAKVAFNTTAAVPVNPNESISVLTRPWRSTWTIPGHAKVDSVKRDILSYATSINGNVGGLSSQPNRFEIDLVENSLKPGETVYIPVKFFMPLPVPTNFTFTVSGPGNTGELSFGRLAENPTATVADRLTCEMLGVNAAAIPVWVQPTNGGGISDKKMYQHMGVIYLNTQWSSKAPFVGAEWERVCEI